VLEQKFVYFSITIFAFRCINVNAFLFEARKQALVTNRFLSVLIFYVLNHETEIAAFKSKSFGLFKGTKIIASIVRTSFDKC